MVRARMKAYRLLFVVLSLLLILFGLGSAVLLVVEPFIPNGVAGLLLAFLLSQRMVMTGVLTVALIGFGLWALTRRSPDGTETRDPRVLLAGQKRRMAIVFALFLSLPYGKFVHGLYRFLALIKYAGERRSGTFVD